LVDRTTVSIHGSGDIANADHDNYESPVIISKAYQSFQDDSLNVNELHDVTRENLMSEFDSDKIAIDEPIIASPDRIKPDITSVIRSPMELTYEHMPRSMLQ
jgi:hypothetical protein